PVVRRRGLRGTLRGPLRGGPAPRTDRRDHRTGPGGGRPRPLSGASARRLPGPLPAGRGSLTLSTTRQNGADGGPQRPEPPAHPPQRAERGRRARRADRRTLALADRRRAEGAGAARPELRGEAAGGAPRGDRPPAAPARDLSV